MGSTAVGVVAAGAAGAWLAWLSLRRPAAGRWPVYGWVGLAALALLELLLALRVGWVDTFFTALVWTAYIAVIDAAVRRLRGTSLASRPRAFGALALLSIPVWLIFEAYNLRLHNWIYVGVPRQYGLFLVGAGWAFATILPAIFETADLIGSAGWSRLRCRPATISRATEWALIAAGAILLVAPLTLPARWAPYGFGPVWVGAVLLLDPLNRRRGLDSLLGQWSAGRPGATCALLAAGAVCGIFWEFWNYWATARWWYVFPILQRWRIFAMPAPGFLGFPPFALECYVLTVGLGYALLPPRYRPQLWPW